MSDYIQREAGDPPTEDLLAVFAEYREATSHYDPFHSMHEGFAVLLEEVDELWNEVKKNPRERDPAKVRAECIQVAAMAMRFLADCTTPDGIPDPDEDS